MDKLVERFLRYVKYDTESKEDSDNFPSTPGQLVLLKDLANELTTIGMRHVTIDEHGYVLAELPSNIGDNIPAIGFIAHVDTSGAMSGHNVNPKIINDYDGSDIILNEEQNIVLSPDNFPNLYEYRGQDIITTDGTTLLGADDKAGVAEIITAMEYLIDHPEIKHGTIKVGFTPDEEVGRGVDFFDVKKFNADFAYTVDGGRVGELEYENFNAARAIVTVNGKSVHTGTAKGIMKNSLLIASEYISLLPENETPAETEGYEGFYHIDTLNGSVEQTKMKYIIRDFSINGLEKRKEYMRNMVQKLNEKYGDNTLTIDIKDQYYNMVEKIKEHKHIVDIAYKAMEQVGVRPVINPIRGGTDGARLSFMGLPCPNLFTGGHNFHGRFEYIPIPSMQKAVDVIIEIVKQTVSPIKEWK